MVSDNWFNSGYWKFNVTPPTKKVSAGKIININKEIKPAGTCLPISSLWFFAYLKKCLNYHG